MRTIISLRRHRPRVRSILGLVLLSLSVAAPPANAAAFNAILVSPDPTEDESVTVTVSGSTEIPRTLFVYWRSVSGSCSAASAYSEDTFYGGEPLTPAGGQPLGSGAFSHQFGFTPSEATTHQLCAYVSNSITAAPAATRFDTVSVRLPQASINPIVVSADPTEDEQVTITVAGTSEANRTLFVYWRSVSGSCSAASAYSEDTYYGGTPLTPASGQPVTSGSFEHQYSFTPTSSTQHQVCAYVSESATTPPLTARSDAFAPRRAVAPISITMPTSFAPGETVEATIAVDAEHAGTKLLWHVTTSDGCDRAQSTQETALPVGWSSTRASFVTLKATSYVLCATTKDNAGSLDVKSLRINKIAATLASAEPAPDAKIVNGRPNFAWRRMNWTERGTTTLLVASSPALDANGVLANPDVLRLKSCNDEEFDFWDEDDTCMPGGAVDAARWSHELSHALAAGEYWWMVRGTETGYGVSMTSVRRFVVPVRRGLFVGTAKVSKSKSRILIVNFNEQDNARSHSVVVTVWRGRQRLAITSAEYAPSFRPVHRQLALRLGSRVATGQRIRVVVTLLDASGRMARTTATTVPALPRPRPRPRPSSGTGDGGSCHPSYSGACLKQGAGDYDCSGGSGNGPNYTGPVRVVGPDEFDLDRDGDGWGCED